MGSLELCGLGAADVGLERLEGGWQEHGGLLTLAASLQQPWTDPGDPDKRASEAAPPLQSPDPP